MSQPHPASNPFELMTNPQAVFAALERMEQSGRLQGRICRPLDKPLIGQRAGEAAAFDDAVDRAAEAGAEAAGADPSE